MANRTRFVFAEQEQEVSILMGLPLDPKRHPKIVKRILEQDEFKQAVGRNLERLINQFLDGAEPHIIA